MAICVTQCIAMFQVSGKRLQADGKQHQKVWICPFFQKIIVIVLQFDKNKEIGNRLTQLADHGKVKLVLPGHGEVEYTFTFRGATETNFR